jgi:hypothetical protein
MRVLRVARNSARSARTQCLNQMRSLISTAPEAIRAELRGPQRVSPPGAHQRVPTRPKRGVASLTKFTLRTLETRGRSTHRNGCVRSLRRRCHHRPQRSRPRSVRRFVRPRDRRGGIGTLL